ncbi:uncharacterized protein LOC130766721 [Actinidia eriantha]|uniref:uncharacterized protein LOC130766721 n=1 Tax=Actinidia eriantha TaxID=165200 RepID=UPI00258E3179|nr:uncharacterized protein LOC130766721 [Actinidia eriantha]
MFYRGYGDVGDGYEMGPKRQRVIDQGSSFYGTPPGSSFMYNPPPYSYISQIPPFPVVRLHGLPFDCSEVDIVEFFHGLDIVDILFVHKNGKFSGEAYCVLAYSIQVDFALQRNRQNIGRRYVEVFRCKRQEYYKAIANEVSDSHGGSPHRNVSRAKSSDNGKESAEHTGVLRLRGLPFSASKDNIMDFFKDFVISEDAIHIIINSEGRPTGEAFVGFASAEDSKAAMSKDRKRLGNRYIELFPSTHDELDAAVSRSRSNISNNPKSSEEGKDSDEHSGVLRMRGLPFSAGKEDIIDFFKDFVLSEDSVHVTFNSGGRPTGEAFVEFANAEDSKAAMTKDRMTLGSRYIELFPASFEELNEAVSRAR